MYVPENVRVDIENTQQPALPVPMNRAHIFWKDRFQHDSGTYYAIASILLEIDKQIEKHYDQPADDLTRRMMLEAIDVTLKNLVVGRLLEAGRVEIMYALQRPNRRPQHSTCIIVRGRIPCLSSFVIHAGGYPEALDTAAKRDAWIISLQDGSSHLFR